jgi:hypothetical protein
VYKQLPGDSTRVSKHVGVIRKKATVNKYSVHFFVKQKKKKKKKKQMKLARTCSKSEE